MSEQPLGIGSAPPETVLAAPPEAWSAALAPAVEHAGFDRAAARAAASAAAGRFPAYLEAWATLAELTSDPVESYAYARVGYHRGLDALRAAGWKGSGYVRWRHPSNRGFLRCLEALGAAAAALGEEDEAERCRRFRRQLDPQAASPEVDPQAASAQVDP
ncbi:MAG TPA: DUF3151 family protein [Acidimicrobiales bacterium]|nr:DUF3151 family protein [Acidimicrobiales bacterium]